MKFLFYILLSIVGLKAQALVVLPIGGQKELISRSQEKIFLSDGSVLKILDLGQSIKVIGKKTGTTKLTLGSKEIEFVVLDQKNYEFYSQCQSLLKELKGLQLVMKGQSLSIQGQLLRLSDWQKVSQLYTAGMAYQFNAKIHSQVQKSVELFLDDRFKELDQEDYELRFNQDRITLLLSHPNPDVLNFLNQFGLPYTPLNTQVQIKPLVKVNITIAEVNRDFNRNLGFHWTPNLSAELIDSRFLANGNLISHLQFLESEGKAKVLASPVLISKSGKFSEFHAGGEFPIKTMGYKTQGVSWKRYGLYLKIKPLATRGGAIDLEIQSEVSDIDLSQKTQQGIPAFKTNRLVSNFNLKKSKTIMLSGLIKYNEGHSKNQVPFLASIPLFGHLFQSQKFKQNKTELVIFVTPQIIEESS